MVRVQTESAEATRALAERVGAAAGSGDVLLLYGALGAGKTTFVQGLARGIGASEPVTSPTFTLVHEYRSGRVPLFHMDAYRLEGAADLEGIGLDEYLRAEGVLVVEWAERLGADAPAQRLEVRIEASGADRRSLRLLAVGGRPARLLKEAGLC
ncbi:MAG: tRNA (adenosine(37)-N6)-threonylcarbamoyltransferase complex ATPase subunit type 1 TsaE [Chthonomonadales bacterium]|nr:tRNA (adenosine(37)-N6)-threonylcarbamoyltransferase complex ATPase subunit type 1 TsaE [Chthonomonadales bacterium]